MFFWRRRKNTAPDSEPEDANSLTEPSMRYLYWFPADEFDRAHRLLEQEGFALESAGLTPCQVLKSRGRWIVYAPPKVWNGMCNRQGSWYRESHRSGQYMLMSTQRLPPAWDRFLAAEMSVSGFSPQALPEESQLQALVDSTAYADSRPNEWERINWKDSLLIKILFTITRFWRRGDGFRKHWLGHRANHANFLARRYTTRMDGEDVPYSVTENASVCSSCAEFFNIIAPQSRKLVRACPGSITISGALRDVYYDVKPVMCPTHRHQQPLEGITSKETQAESTAGSLASAVN